ncbi:undecaprenyl-diphosphatase [Enterococcus sp. PF1-24]|uniref:phosphatase PAP2 family protein n=1 Tax=unclassified Enterococcus TaxID=2608891 RepID=UPI002476E98D|nr:MULTISPECIES: phosphatase PAP2 family protein [unclassified Enterococcus]MDH6363396.1 undecaprenyl-diphosphatase [Enterococcus sp. PFB1-1]MDH6400490.1 undecaprenyl-diphosphatase [Enterococcus sp. PF1-24]
MKNKLYYQFFSSCCLLVCFFLGYVVRFHEGWLRSFDDILTNAIRFSYPNGHGFFMWITKFANPLSIVLLVAACALLLLKGKRYIESLWLVSNLAIVSGVFNPLLKLVFQRNRPTLEHLVVEHSYSFPSGHAAASMIFYGTLIVLLGIFISNQKVRLASQILLGLLILLIGCSRVYLGVHFPSDIIGGYLVGLTWLTFTYPFFDQLRFTWRFKGKQA